MGAGRCAGHFTVQVENHVLLLHFGENGVEGLVGEYARGRVSGDSCGVGFDTSDACLLCFDNHLRCDVLVQVQRDEVVDIGLDGAKAVPVLQGCLD